jgi:hypothetical protein
MLMPTMTIDSKDLMILRARGDGNCGPRAVIQSLLAQAILQDKKVWVINFIRELIHRNEARVKNAYHLDKPATFDPFIAHYETLAFEQLATFAQDFFIKKAEPSKTDDFLNQDVQEKVHTLLDRQPSLESTDELNAILEPVNHSPDDNDYVLYYLNACLRQDMFTFHHENANVPTTDLDAAALEIKKAEDEKHLKDLEQLDTYVAIGEQASRYFQAHKISLSIYNAEDNKAKPNHYINNLSNDTESEITIHLLYDSRSQGSEHYDALLLSNEDSKVLQIKQDEELAKELQTKEIEDFAARFEASDNKNNLAFLNSLIENLGLKEGLDVEQWNHARAAQSTITPKQISESLQPIIHDQGYSTDFKEKFKQQIQLYSPTFFSPCRQEAMDTTQPLHVIPAIKV